MHSERILASSLGNKTIPSRIVLLRHDLQPKFLPHVVTRAAPQAVLQVTRHASEMMDRAPACPTVSLPCLEVYAEDVLPVVVLCDGRVADRLVLLVSPAAADSGPDLVVDGVVLLDLG